MNLAQPIETVLVLNKMDLVDSKEELEAQIEEYRKVFDFSEHFIISADKNKNLDILKDFLISKAKPGPWLYPKSWKTDMTTLERVEEVIREHVYKQTNEEVPHVTGQEVSGWLPTPQGGIVINAHLIPKNKHHLRLLIGSGGRTIRRISMGACKDLTSVLHNPDVYLNLNVKMPTT